MIQLTPLWDQIKQRLINDPVVQDLLYGPGHVYLEAEDYSRPERDEGVPWMRLVVAPAMSLWPEDGAPGPTQQVAFIVRAECNRFDQIGYDHQLALEAVQQAVQNCLQHYVPPPVAGCNTWVVFPLFMQRMIEPRLLWDDLRQVFFLTSEYRCEVNVT